MTEALFELTDTLGQMPSTEWTVDAACASGDVDPDLFFNPYRIPEARRVCMACPVRTACKDYAMARLRQDDVVEAGMWGGQSEDERLRLYEKHRPGPQRNQDLEDEIMRLSDEGRSGAEIAAAVGVSSRTVSRVRARAVKETA